MSENSNSLVCETYTRENLFDGVSCETYVDRGVRGDSAYKQAVDGGYTGTLEQFEALLAEDLNTLAANISNINTVGSISTDVTAVAGIASDVSAVEDIKTDVTAVANNATNINAAVSNATNINTVAGNATNINTVSTNISNVNTAATNMSAIIAAPTAAANASTSATNAQTWAEGNDTAVTALGGEHSSKGWAQTAQYYAKHTGKSIGEVYYSQSSSASDNPGGLPLFTGETIANADQVYPDFYAWVLSHTELCKTEAQWQSRFSTYGECPYYVIDTVNKTIHLPLLKNYVKMANTTDGITQQNAGLPDITAKLGQYANTEGEISATVSGAAYAEQDTGSSGGYVQFVSGSNYKSKFAASRSNSVYGQSVTVRPAYTSLYPWVCAYNAAVPASTAQAAEFQTALTGKADVGLGNLTNAGKIKSAHLAMPSSTYTNLTISASGSAYTAPADGYVVFSQRCDNVGEAIELNGGVAYRYLAAKANKMYRISMPISKGFTFYVFYDSSNSDRELRFCYAVGSTSEAN